MERRDFIRTAGSSILLAGTPGVFPNIITNKKAAKYRLAIIGPGWWGMNILRVAMADGTCKVVGICDVDESIMNDSKAEIEKLSGDKPKLYTDFRELLKKEKPDITIIATPDHWHALPAIAAMESGSHVYLEKPISHTINEGKAIVEAQKRTGKVVQVGLHRHICPHNVSGMEFLRSGKAGKIYSAKAFVTYHWRPTPITTESTPPTGLDWDMWLGPSPKRSYNPCYHPRGFRDFLDFSNGVISDWGVHWFDQILWWADEKQPRKIYSNGGILERENGADTPDFQNATFEFDSFTATWEHRKQGGKGGKDARVGVYFYGTKGVFHMGWMDGWTFYPNSRGGQEIHEDTGVNEPDGQNIMELWDDFILAIENNKKPVADIQNSYYATNLSLLAMISYRTGRLIEWDPVKQTIVNDDAAARLMQRPYRDPWRYPV